MGFEGPAADCGLCPRLVEFRRANAVAFPDWHNAPVSSFGSRDARLLIVGLAPGLRGANRTGRPFTGDFAGDLLYPTIKAFGFGTGTFGARPDDARVVEVAFGDDVDAAGAALRNVLGLPPTDGTVIVPVTPPLPDRIGRD